MQLLVLCTGRDLLIYFNLESKVRDKQMGISVHVHTFITVLILYIMN